MTVAWTTYRLLAPCVGALAPAARALTSPEERELWYERLGRVALEGGCDAWVHSASLGEATAVGPLVDALRARAPRARFYLTASTRAGRARLAELGLPVSLAPIDSPQAVRRFFTGVHPERLILVETELWPHWLMRARDQRVPAAVVSARLSEGSVQRYRRLGTGLSDLVAGLEAVLCQTAEDARRWLELGARPDRTVVAGNLKADSLPPAIESREAARRSLGLDSDRPLLVLGSIRPGEVGILAQAWAALPAVLRERWQVVAVPRHPYASAELEEEAARAGQRRVREGAPRAGAWRWDQRSGVLNRYYAAGDVAFVGGSLLPYGGHNPIEPAAFGLAVIMGNHHASQAEAVRALSEREAIEIVGSEAELASSLGVLLSNPELREKRGRAALVGADAQRGAARRTVARLAEWGLWSLA